MIAGVAGARRDAAVALCRGGDIVAVCGRERVARSRAVGARGGGSPNDAVNMALEISHGRLEDIASYAVAEAGFPLPPHLSCLRLDHHYAHAATAALTSPF